MTLRLNHLWRSGEQFIFPFRFNLILVVVFVIPAMQEMNKAIMPKSSGGGQTETIMQAAMGFGAVFGVVCTCLYPILSLVLLNRPVVKDWLGRHGK